MVIPFTKLEKTVGRAGLEGEIKISVLDRLYLRGLELPSKSIRETAARTRLGFGERPG